MIQADTRDQRLHGPPRKVRDLCQIINLYCGDLPQIPQRCVLDLDGLLSRRRRRRRPRRRHALVVRSVRHPSASRCFRFEPPATRHGRRRGESGLQTQESPSRSIFQIVRSLARDRAPGGRARIRWKGLRVRRTDRARRRPRRRRVRRRAASSREFASRGIAPPAERAAARERRT